jgi:hypothetical protein
MADGWTPTSENRLIALAQEDALTAAQECAAEVTLLETGYRDRLYDVLAGIYAVGSQLHRKRAEWRKFAAAWTSAKNRPKPEKGRKRAMFWVVVFVFNSRGKRQMDRAYDYARALDYFHSKNIPAEEIAERINQTGGIDGVIRKARKQFPRRTNPPSAAKGLDEQKVNSQNVGAADKRRTQAARRSEGVAEIVAQRTRSAANAKTILKVALQPADLIRVLGMGEGRKAVVTIKSAGRREDGWIRMSATKVQIFRKKSKK